MDEEKEKRKDEFYKTFFLLLMLFGTSKGRKRKILAKMKEIEQEPGGNGGD